MELSVVERCCFIGKLFVVNWVISGQAEILRGSTDGKLQSEDGQSINMQCPFELMHVAAFEEEQLSSKKTNKCKRWVVLFFTFNTV